MGTVQRSLPENYTTKFNISEIHKVRSLLLIYKIRICIFFFRQGSEEMSHTYHACVFIYLFLFPRAGIYARKKHSGSFITITSRSRLFFGLFLTFSFFCLIYTFVFLCHQTPSIVPMKKNPACVPAPGFDNIKSVHL